MDCFDIKGFSSLINSVSLRYVHEKGSCYPFLEFPHKMRSKPIWLVVVLSFFSIEIINNSYVADSANYRIKNFIFTFKMLIIKKINTD